MGSDHSRESAKFGVPPSARGSARKPATIQDVARHARVSIATVSRVLNGAGSVDHELAARVRVSIMALQYRPNRAARALAGGRPVLIGVVLGDLLNPFFVEITQGIEDTMHEHGYLLVLCHYTADATRERQYVEILCAERVAGVIINPMDHRNTALLREYGIPVVSIDQRPKDDTIDVVLIDNRRAACEAVSHLIANGYRRIGAISGRPDSTTGRERLAGYRQALEEAGLPFDPAIARYGPYTEASGYQLTGELLASQPTLDGLFTANNRITQGALNSIHARGLRIPDDLGLVAIDDVPWVTPGSVSLTAVIQPAYELGATAATRLIQLIQQPDTQPPAVRQEIILAHRLRLGDSSRPRHSMVVVEALD